MKSKFVVMTNNPLVLETFGAEMEVAYEDLSFDNLLMKVRDRVHEGYVILSHPLSGSVKPKETPYKSILMSVDKGDIDPDSLTLIENAIMASTKFVDRTERFGGRADRDFMLIDLTLLKSATDSLYAS